MKGLEQIFAKVFDKEAKSRGFVVLEEMPAFGANPLYKTEEWLICSMMQTGFPDTTVTIMLTPQNPPPETSRQHLRKCEATWIADKKSWFLQNQLYKTEELIAYAFDQMSGAARIN